MGKQHSKTTNQKQSTDCSSSSSLKASAQIFQLQPISCSPKKLRQISRVIKIKTTCVLKSPQKKCSSAISLKRVSIIKSFQIILSQISQNFAKKKETQQRMALQVKDTQKRHQNQMRNPDIDRINSLFIFQKQNINQDQFLTRSIDDRIQILNWKNSVNKILADLQKIYQYRQGQLLTCAIMRSFFAEELTYNFLNQLLGKVGNILCSAEQLNTFSGQLSEKCIKKCPFLFKKLSQNDLDFQFIYTSWILGLFSSNLPKETCIRIWFKLSKSQSPVQNLQQVLLQCMHSIQQNLQKLALQNQRPGQANFFQFTNQNVSKLINVQRLNQLINDSPEI